MPTVRDIATALTVRTQPTGVPDWDPVGLQLGDLDATIASVGVCHEVSEAVVSNLEDDPVDLLVTYHPLLFAPTNRVLAGRSAGGRSYRLMRAGVNLLVTHSDFDAVPGGAADALAAFFDLADVMAFGGEAEVGAPQIGRVGRFGREFGELEKRLSDAYGSTGLRMSGDRAQVIERLAVVPGSGASYIETAAALADALVTGDVSHHRAVAARDLGLAIADPGHTATERPGMTALVGLVADITDVEVRDLTRLDPQAWD